MPDQVGEHVQLADVARIDRVGGKTLGAVDVRDHRDVAQPVLHHGQHLVGGGKRARDAGRILREVRQRHHAQRSGRHHVLGRIEEKLLQFVRRDVVARDVVEGIRAWLSLAQLHAQWRRPAEGDFGPQGDVALGIGPADLCLRDHQRFGGEQLLEVRDRLLDVCVLC